MNIAFFTSNRSDYGLLRSIIQLASNSEGFNCCIIASGAHCYTSSIEEIYLDNFAPVVKCPIIPETDSSQSIVAAMGKGLLEINHIFSSLSPDIIILLGDRYETLVAAQAAHLMQIILLHISGGEVTIGSLDDSIRHSISKFSDYHFVANEDFYKRLLRLGEHPSRVFISGGMGIDALDKIQLLPRDVVYENLQIIRVDLPILMCTYHPTSIRHEWGSDFETMLSELSRFSCFYNIIFTLPAPESGYRFIVSKLHKFANDYPNVQVKASLGQIMYLSTVKHAKLVVGNSSSGIAEAPYLGTCTVDIGSRQAGRPKAPCVFHVKDVSQLRNALVSSLNYIFPSNFSVLPGFCPYGKSGASHFIINFIKNHELTKKSGFYDG